MNGFEESLNGLCASWVGRASITGVSIGGCHKTGSNEKKARPLACRNAVVAERFAVQGAVRARWCQKKTTYGLTKKQ